MLGLTRGDSNKDFCKKILSIAAENHKPLSFVSLKNRVRFFLLANKQRQKIEGFSERISALNLKVTPQMLGVIEWPYIHNDWDVGAKFDKLATHYEILSNSFPILTRLNDSVPYEVLDLTHISAGVRVAIDHAPWFVREGEMVINVFQHDLRVASMAFTLGRLDGCVVSYIGAVQGIHSGVSTAESLEIYKVLTKDFEGLRPRSLLIEVLKLVLVQFGVKKVFAISEQHRHHRHKYFGNNEKTIFKTDYNVFWEEHDGVFDVASGFYTIPIELSIRDMADIPSKKRSMYKRRYEIINFLKNNINLSNAKV
jgi:uncharacterized protein VirK/YbjX